MKYLLVAFFVIAYIFGVFVGKITAVEYGYGRGDSGIVMVEAEDIGVVFTDSQEILVIRQFLIEKYPGEFENFEKFFLKVFRSNKE